MSGTYGKKDSYKWMILTISFLLMLVFAISLQALPPIFGNIMKDIPFSNSQAGLLMGAYSFLGIFMPFLVAVLLKKFQLKKILIIALIAVILGLIGFSLSSSYSLLLIFRLLSGAGTTILAVLSPLLITMFFEQRNMGIAMGVFNTAVPLGTVVAANLFGYLGLFMNWRAIIMGIAIFTTMILVIIFFFLVLPKNHNKNDSNSARLQFNLGASLWFLGIIWMIANSQLLTYTTFGPQFFKISGMSTHQSGLLTSLITLMSIFVAPIVGIIIDKTSQKKLFLLMGSIIMGVSFFAISTSGLSFLVWAVALGIGFSFVPVAIFSLLPEVAKPEQTSMGLAVISASSSLGITIGPAGFGSLLDATSGNFVMVFTLLSILSLVSVLVTLGITTKTRT